MTTPETPQPVTTLGPPRLDGYSRPTFEVFSDGVAIGLIIRTSSHPTEPRGRMRYRTTSRPVVRWMAVSQDAGVIADELRRKDAVADLLEHVARRG